ncbi:hypothetical protein PVK06_033688 [Gossypium arboreum]|uniref:SWIM-type domain-containing protein n=1 Tax=Gossypium arboreum TaxID=29729 RepID=A0ABR0NF04_GOSAR|nr:hypothetical protein PVK06_033688 [Gossypium arboreum]
MHNVDLSQDDALEFPDLPHRRRDRTSSSLDSGELEVGKEFSNKDSFLDALKQHSIMNGVNYNVVKSKSNKLEAKCAVQNGVSEDHPKMNSDMLATLILPMVKADPRTSVSVLIFNIRSQLRYTPSYRKAWIAKQKALEKIHGGWDASYNEVWQWCQVLERFVPGCVTDLETEPVLQEINKAKARENTMHTVCHDRDNLWFRVKEFEKPYEGIIGGQYRVHLRNRTCDCRRFDTLRYPCAHVIADCQNLRLDLMSYVDEVYKLETMYNV